MTIRDDYDPSCFGCGVPRTVNGHLCSECLRRRFGTIHPNWENPIYLEWITEEVARMDRRNEQQRAQEAASRQRREAA